MLHFEFLFKNFYLFGYFGLCWLFIAAHGLFLVVASRGYSLVGMCGLLIAVASLVSEQRLQGPQASVVVAHGLSSFGGMWNPPGPRIEPMSSALAGRLLTTGPPEKACILNFLSFKEDRK